MSIGLALQIGSLIQGLAYGAVIGVVAGILWIIGYELGLWD